MAGTICWILLLLGIAAAVGMVVIRYSKIGYEIHVAPFVSAGAYIFTLLINSAFGALFFWQYAIGFSCFASLLAFCIARGIQNKAYFDEKNGKWGLSPELREVRGELYSDQSPEQQLEDKAETEASFKKLHPVYFFLLSLVIPAIFIAVLYLCGLGYITVPHALQ